MKSIDLQLLVVAFSLIDLQRADGGRLYRLRRGGRTVRTADDENEQRLANGSHALVFGLKSATELNDVEVVVQGFDEQTGRYVVQTPGGTSDGTILRKVLPEHLRPLLAPPGESEEQASADAVAAMTPAERHEKAMELFMKDIARRTSEVAHQENLPGGSADSGSALIPRGSKVVLEGLHSSPELNGHAGTVRTFDYGTGRYIVQLPGMPPRRVRPRNLRLASARQGREGDVDAGQVDRADRGDESSTRRAAASARSICQKVLESAGDEGVDPVASGPLGLALGAQVLIHNLTSAVAIQNGWNGMTGVVHCFEPDSGRYVVSLPNGLPRKLKPENLQRMEKPQAGSLNDNVEGKQMSSSPVPKAGKSGLLLHHRSGSEKATSNQSAAMGKPFEPQVSICNAYPSSTPMQVFALRSDAPHQYKLLLHDLPYQECGSVSSFPYLAGSLTFVIGRYQVGRFALHEGDLNERAALELTVHRNDVNTLRASVHKNIVDLGDKQAYYLHIVNAYAGSKLVELHVQRGHFAQRLPLNGSYRLTREQALSLTLTDGFQRLHMGFQPQHSRTYCVVLTGVDAGLHGEPRNIGMIAHELGAWTSSEEMPETAATAQAQKFFGGANTNVPQASQSGTLLATGVTQEKPSFFAGMCRRLANGFAGLFRFL